MESFFNKLFSSVRDGVITVAHGNEKYDVEFEPGQVEGGRVTVGELRDSCVEFTKAPRQQIRLLYRGKLLSQDAVKLSDVGIRSGSKVLCMATKNLPRNGGNDASERKERELANARNNPIEALLKLRGSIERDIEPEVERYLAAEENKEQHDRLAELLLQKLFLLDGIVATETFAEDQRLELRQKRKEAVQYAQGLLDRIDKQVKE
ncbi:hypothetical protein PYCC9005_002746 [Savitreella phatthalungensis]